MNLQQQEQFYQMVKRSRAASLSTDVETRITEVQNGIIVTRPLKKVEYISDSEPKNTEPQARARARAQAKVWNLTK